MRRIVNDAERILNDIDRLDIDAEELDLVRGFSHHHHVGEKIGIPDTQYASDFGRTSTTKDSAGLASGAA